MIAWAIKSEDGGIIPFTVDASKADAWGRICGRGYIKHYKSNGYRAVRVDVREVNATGQENGTGSEAATLVRAPIDQSGTPGPAAPEALADELQNWLAYTKLPSLGLRREEISLCVAALRQSGAGSGFDSAASRLQGALIALRQCKPLIPPANWPEYAQQVLDHNDAAIKERT